MLKLLIRSNTFKPFSGIQIFPSKFNFSRNIFKLKILSFALFFQDKTNVLIIPRHTLPFIIANLKTRNSNIQVSYKWSSQYLLHYRAISYLEIFLESTRKLRAVLQLP